MSALIFPGQGAQHVGMGKSFYDSSSIFREVIEEAEDLVRWNIRERIFSGPEGILAQTQYAQVALYVVCYGVFKVLSSIVPLHSIQSVAGLSLGEYTALTAGGYLRFQDGLMLVQQRGNAMHEASVAYPGTMMVCLGTDHLTIQDLLEELGAEVWIANINCPGQVVISGVIQSMEKAKEYLMAKGVKKILPLDVSGAFHSGLMKSAQEHMKERIIECEFSSGSVPICMNVTGAFTTDPKEIQSLLVKQITSPTFWWRSIQAIEERAPTRYVEVGCGKTLTGMNKRIGISRPSFSIQTIDDLALLEESYARNI